MSLITIKEKVMTEHFDSSRHGLRLRSRQADTPDIKGEDASIQYMNGSFDFSMIIGEEFYEDRIIKFEFGAVRMTKEQRKVLEAKVKQELMGKGRIPIFDTWKYGYFWYGKCVKVKVKDDPRNHGTEVNIEFQVYPYMLSVHSFFHDIWDIFSFDDDVASYNAFTVNGELDIELYNNGASSVIPEIIVQAKTPLKAGTDSTGETVTETKVIEGTKYTVKSGDVLWRIANMYKTTVANICKWNNIRATDFIFPGQVLYVSAPKTVTTTTETEVTTKPVFMEIDFYGDIIKLDNSTNKNTRLVLKQGVNRLKIKGTGTIGFEYRTEVMA